MTPEENQSETAILNKPKAIESKEFERVEKIGCFETNNFGDWEITRLVLNLPLIK